MNQVKGNSGFKCLKSGVKNDASKGSDDHGPGLLYRTYGLAGSRTDDG